MPNHVHLLVTPDAGDGVAMMMQEVGRRYVRLFNDTHKRTGTLWEGRYKAAMIDSERYFLICQRYVEQNPLRAELVKNAADYSWSSHRNSAFGIRNSLVTPHEIFAALGRDDDERRAAYAALFAEPIPAREIEKIREATNKGWPLGSESFVRRIEAAVGRPARAQKRGRKSAGAEQSADLADCPEILI
jgi:putative transposase